MTGTYSEKFVQASSAMPPGNTLQRRACFSGTLYGQTAPLFLVCWILARPADLLELGVEIEVLEGRDTRGIRRHLLLQRLVVVLGADRPQRLEVIGNACLTQEQVHSDVA